MRGHSIGRDIESERLLRRGLCRPLDTIIKKMPDSEKQQYLNVIIPKLKDANKSVRGRAAWALGELGDARAVEPLMEALKDESENVRSGAAWALEKIGDTRAVEPLMEVLKDESENVRWGAADALIKIRSKKRN